jgi:hypothetical protein
MSLTASTFVVLFGLLHALGTTPSAVAAGQSSRQPANVAGEWAVVFQTVREITVTMTLRQQDARLSGHVTMERGEMPLTGRVEGREVTINWTIYEGGTKIDIVFIGIVDGDQITGVARSHLGEGELHAQRN